MKKVWEFWENIQDFSWKIRWFRELFRWISGVQIPDSKRFSGMILLIFDFSFT